MKTSTSSKKKPIQMSVVYLASLLVNGAFWLLFADGIRRTSGETTPQQPSATTRREALPIGRFTPLPSRPQPPHFPAQWDPKLGIHVT